MVERSPLTYVVLVNNGTNNSQAPVSALNFCTALLARGHTIHCVFFYHDAVLLGSRLVIIGDEEINIAENWQQFAQKSKTRCLLCVNNALSRGILDASYAQQYQQSTHNLASGFQITGLTTLFSGIALADRFIQFR